MEDARDGFPIFIDAVRRLQPKVFLFENVANILGRHKWYLDLIVQELQNLGYIVEYKVLNAVDYGVPQRRERLICVGHRASFHFPAIEREKRTVAEAIGDTMLSPEPESKILTSRQDEYIAVYEKKSHCVNPRDLYPDRPARTITCRNLAGATSDMQRVRLADGRRRRLTYREAARLQTFPDWFEFSGTETKQFYQIGNAVPPLLAYKIAQQVKNTYYLEQKSEEYILQRNIPNSLFGFDFSTVPSSRIAKVISNVTGDMLDEKEESVVMSICAMFVRTDYIRFAQGSIDSKLLPSNEHKAELQFDRYF